MYRRYRAPWTGGLIRDSLVFPLPGMKSRIENLVGAGAVVASLNNLLAWGQIANQRSVLRSNSWARMETPLLDDYGYGWVIEKRKGSGESVVWHNGQWAGNYALIFRWPQRKMTAVFLTNNQISTTEKHQEFKKSLSRFFKEADYLILKLKN